MLDRLRVGGTLSRVSTGQLRGPALGCQAGPRSTWVLVREADRSHIKEEMLVLTARGFGLLEPIPGRGAAGAVSMFMCTASAGEPGYTQQPGPRLPGRSRLCRFPGLITH